MFMAFLASSLLGALSTPAWILAARTINLDAPKLDTGSLWIGLTLLLGMFAKGNQQRTGLILEARMKIKAGSGIMGLPLMSKQDQILEPDRNRALQLFPDLPFRICTVAGNLVNASCSIIFLLVISGQEFSMVFPLLLLMVSIEILLTRTMAFKENELLQNNLENIYTCANGKIRIARDGIHFSRWTEILQLEQTMIRDRLSLDLQKNRMHLVSRISIVAGIGLVFYGLISTGLLPGRIPVLGVTLWRSFQALNQLAPVIYHGPRLRYLVRYWEKANL
jgi:hypothetical protein